MRPRAFLIATAALLLLAGCTPDDTLSPVPGNATGFVFTVDPHGQTVTRIQPEVTLRPEFLPSNTRILVPDEDLELSSFHYQFTSGNKLVIASRFRNIHSRADYHLPFFFTPNALDHAVRASAPLVTDGDLGGDGRLTPGEETSQLTFEVVHQGRPFTFLVDASAVTVTMIDLGTLGGITSDGWDINERGQVIGWDESVAPSCGKTA